MSKDNTNNTDGRKKFRIKVDPEEFSPIGEFKIVTSDEFASAYYTILKSVFVDFEGILFNPGNGSAPTLELLFNHNGSYSEDGIRALVNPADPKTKGSTVLDRVRARDDIYLNGDKYLLSEDAQDAIKEFLLPALYNGGNVKWNKIVSPWSDRQINTFYNTNNAPQYTKVIGIDLSRVAGLIYGRGEYDYEVSIMAPLNPQYGRTNKYLLRIMRASSDEVKAVYEKVGISIYSNNIIRG
jgi:hypothetical protein